eukprot:m.21059 g.21059  ORF g.21059 m.21059 type:complete len:754 (+) comp7992_c1_seq1:171-2432(+)
MAAPSWTCFSPPSLALETSSEVASSHALFFSASYFQTPSRAATKDTAFVYIPAPLLADSRAGLDPLGTIGDAVVPLEHALDWSLFFCTLRQFSSLAAAQPNAGKALTEAVDNFCHFKPLQAVLTDLLAAPSFDQHVLHRPLWHFWLLQDFLLGAGRALLPMLVPDEIVARRVNFVLAKLIYGRLTRDAVPSPAAAGGATGAGAGAEGADPSVLERLTMPEVAILTEQLLGREEMLRAFNILPMEAFCPVTSTGLVLLNHGGVAFVANHAVSSGVESHLHGPAVRTPPANPNAKNGAPAALIADTATLRDLDVAYYHAADQPDARITQLDVLVVDCSGSMGARAFASDEDMSRADAAQIMFNMTVDKYRSMEITARTACVLFGSDVQLACPFTSDLDQFETLLGRAEAMGQTKLWDAIGLALETLLAEHTRLSAAGLLHPDCRSRVLAMTDGLDNASTMRPVQAARYCRTHRVVLDAFVLGAVDDTDLRTVAAATGGLTLTFRDMDDAIELFERPHVVQVALRPEKQLPPVGPTRDSMRVFGDLAQYPRVTSETARELATTRRAPQVVAPATLLPGAPAPTGGVVPPTAPSTALALFARRMAAELATLQTTGLANGIIAIDSTILTSLKFIIKGLPTGVYANSYLLVEVNVPAEYPFRPPRVELKSAVYHPQVNTGNVCDAARSSWSPAQNIATALQSLRTLLETPNADSAINTTAATMYSDNRAQYDINVAAMLPALTEVAARGTSTNWNNCT